MPESDPAVVILQRRLADPPAAPSADQAVLRLALSADERTRLRGRRRSVCGRELLLQLERGQPLRPGEWLMGAAGDPPVRVEAAPEPLLRVRGEDPLALLQAAYHLGNRHVALEVRQQELRLLDDPVLADLLLRRGLRLERLEAPFLPEPGAYAEGHGHQPSPHQPSHHAPGPHAHDHGDQEARLDDHHGPEVHGVHSHPQSR